MVWFLPFALANVPQRHRSRNQRKQLPRRRSVLLDAGPIIGLYNELDYWHEESEYFFGQNDTFNYVVTQAVIAEAIYKIQKERNTKFAVQAVVSLLDDVSNGLYELHALDASSIGRIRDLRSKYSDHRKLDFTDQTLVIAAEDLQIGDVVTIDQNDF